MLEEIIKRAALATAQPPQQPRQAHQTCGDPRCQAALLPASLQIIAQGLGRLVVGTAIRRQKKFRQVLSGSLQRTALVGHLRQEIVRLSAAARRRQRQQLQPMGSLPPGVVPPIQ